MASFERALTFLLTNEGGLETNSNDPGGVTNFGISLRFLKNIPLDRLKSYGIFEPATDDTIKALTSTQACCLYHGEFWQHAPFDMIDDQNLCNYVFDMAVNMGIAPAIKCVQRACWSVFNNRQTLPEDGILGEQTLHCINLNDAVFSALRSERAGDYRVIVAAHPAEEEFINDWLNRTYNR